MTQHPAGWNFARWAVGPVLLAMLALSAAGILWVGFRAEAAVERKVRAVAVSVRATMEEGLAFGAPLRDLRGVDLYFQRLLHENADLRSIGLLDHLGHSVVMEGAGGGAFPIQASAIITAPGGKELGRVVVAARSAGILGRMAERADLLAVALIFAGVLTAAGAGQTHLACYAAPIGAIRRMLAEPLTVEPSLPRQLRSSDSLGRLARLVHQAKLLLHDRARHLQAYAEEVHAAVASQTLAARVEEVIAEARSSLGQALFDPLSADSRPPPGGGATVLSLRARITFLVFLAVALATAAISLASFTRENLLDAAAETAAVATLDASWKTLLKDQRLLMEEEAARLAEAPGLAAALVADDPAAVEAIIGPARKRLGAMKVASGIEVAAADGRVFYGYDPHDRASLLGSFALMTVIRSGERLSGLARTEAGQLVSVFSRPVVLGTRTVGAITLARSARTTMAELGAVLGSSVFAVDLEGRPSHGDAPAAWARVARDVPLKSRSVAQAEADGSIYALSIMGLPTVNAGRLGYLVTMRDITAQHVRGDRLRLAFLGLALVLVGLVVWFISHYTRQAFAPLTSAIAALNSLSRGEASVMLDVPVSDDEVGRIAAAVRVFRDQARTLQRVAEERSRRRRRQERMIRQQMLKLAETLQDGAREAVLDDLNTIEREASSRSGAEVAAELDALAIAFQTMASRVREQHRELAMLVGELREALKAKTAFIALQQELEIARELQLSILPKVAAEEAEFEAHALMIPAKEVGGDFYDLFMLSPRRVGMVVADVSGKGVPAALFMAVSRTLLKATALFEVSPGECLEKLNALLHEGNEKSLFVTVFYGILDLETGVLTYANGGHNPPLVIAGDGKVEPLPTTAGIVLAIEPALTYRECSVTLRPGDTLVMFTDGVTEAKNMASAEFGDDRLAALLGGCAGIPARAITARVLEAVQDFAGGGPQADDITCLAFRYKGGARRVDTLEISLRNELAEIPRLREKIETFLDGFGLPADVVFNICLSLDEIFTNIVSYGYDDPSRHEIDVILRHDGHTVSATVVDDGREFDPLANALPPDLESALEDRSVGGLGVFLVRTFMDDVSYSRDGERNRLVIVKKL